MFQNYKHATLSIIILSFLIFPLCSPGRTSSETVTVITAEENARISNSTWRDFTRLVDVEKGSHVSGISDLKRYFNRFGYLTEGTKNYTDAFDSDLESAISLFQKNLGLPATGKLDPVTVGLITSPRCGVSDSHMINSNLHATRRYTYFDGKPRWVRDSPVVLSYAFSKTNMLDSLSFEEIKSAFTTAFSRWAEVIPVNFTEADDYYKSDIKIGFYHGDHGDGMPFDGVLGVLAHSFSPENGRLHMDAAETWVVNLKTTDSRVAVDLESVVTHEIGHVLGLGHSRVKKAVMYPSLPARTKKVELTIDDVEGVQNLYGSNPDFSFSSLLESEDSFNSAGKSGSSRFTASLVLLMVLTVMFLCS